jgi:ferritin
LDKQDREILKLTKLCKHWGDHNDSHKESFLKWQIIAQEKGLESVAEKLNNAIEMLDKCNEFLLAANKELETL